MKQTSKRMIACPECSADVRLKKAPQLGQYLTCRDCNAQLEVVSLTPIELDWATQAQFKEPIDNKRSGKNKKRRRSPALEEQWDHY